MPETPIFPCLFYVDGRSVTEKVAATVTRYGSRFCANHRLGNPGLAIHWLTPDIMLSAFRESVARYAQFTISGSFIGSYGTYGGGPDNSPSYLRDVIALQVALKGSAESISIQASGELRAEVKAEGSSRWPSPTPFRLEFSFPLSELEAMIEDIARKEMAASIVNLLSKPSRCSG